MPGPPRTPEDTPYQGRREDNGEHYTYIQDPDGNQVELPDNTKGLRWKQKADVVT